MNVQDGALRQTLSRAPTMLAKIAIQLFDIGCRQLLQYYLADVRDDMGWVVLELEGEDEEIARGLEWVTATGVRVDPVSGDVVEG